MSGLASLGFPTTDSSYLLAYGETGMLGLAALVAVLACACAWPLRGAVSSDLSTRVVCVGVATGAVLLAAGALTFDAFTSPSVAELFWVLVGIGVAASEHVPVRAPVLTWPVRAAGVVALGVVGLLLALTAPRHVARTWQFETLDAYDATVFAPTYTGRQLRTSFCEVVETRLEGTGTAITCRPSGVAPEVDAPGQGLLRLSATSRAAGEQAAAAATSATSQLRQLHRLRLQARGDWQEGSPSVLRTAPAWLPVLGLVVLLPVGGRRRWEQ
jgi:hypothetical protein